MLRNLLAILRSWYRALFKRQEDARTREIAATLRRIPLFQGLPRGAIRDMADVMHTRAYKREEVLYYEGDPGLGMYLVQQGRVRLVVEDDDGVEHDMRTVDENEIFGVLSVFGDFRRTETAQAVTDARVFGFFRPDLKTIVKRNPRTGAHVIAALARNMAAWQAELVQQVGEQHGHVAARRLLHGAARKLRTYDPELPAVDRS